MTRYIRAYLRAFRQTAQFEPLLIPVAVLLALCMGVKPFINIYFSARIVAELSGAQAVRTLVTLVAVCLGLNFLLQLLTDFLTPTFYMLRSRLYEKERMTVEHKLFRLDFAKLEDSSFQELVHLHTESMDKIFSAFVQLCWMFKDFLTGVVTLVCAVALIFPLLKIGVTKTGEGFLHSPWFLAVLGAGIAVAVVIILRLSSRKRGDRAAFDQRRNDPARDLAAIRSGERVYRHRRSAGGLRRLHLHRRERHARAFRH